jgi:hypothetical protein
MDFSNATILTLSRKSEFLGYSTRYKCTVDMDIEGMLLDLTNTDGVQGIMSQLLSLQNSADNWTDININGVSFGSGIINSVNFSEGNDVRTKKYNISVTVPQASAYDSYGKSYMQYVNGFSESSSYTRDGKKENYNQSVSFELIGPYSLDAVAAAKTMATEFFNNNDLVNTVGTRYSNSSVFKKFYDESYDQINNKFTFERHYEVSTDSSNLYSLYRSHTLSFDESGVGKVKEHAEFISHSSVGFKTINNIYTGIIGLAGAFDRSNSIWSQYFSGSSGYTELVNQPITKSISIMKSELKITYDVEYTNANRLKIAGYYWTHQSEVEQMQGGDYQATASGEIVGFGHIMQGKYEKALAGWNSIKTTVDSDVTTYYPNTESKPLQLINTSLTFQQIDGKIGYSRKYSNSDSVRSSQMIRKETIEISKNFDRNLTTYFSIINNKEIAQKQKNKLPNSISYSIKLSGRADVGLSTYLSRAKQLITNTADYISDINYSYNPADRLFSLSCSVISLPS